MVLLPVTLDVYFRHLQAADDNSRDRLDDEGISKYFPNSARVDVHARVMYRNGGATFDPSLSTTLSMGPYLLPAVIFNLLLFTSSCVAEPGEGLEEVIAGGFP